MGCTMYVANYATEHVLTFHTSSDITSGHPKFGLTSKQVVLTITFQQIVCLKNLAINKILAAVTRARKINCNGRGLRVFTARSLRVQRKASVCLPLGWG